jgi:hypothetical protein
MKSDRGIKLFLFAVLGMGFLGSVAMATALMRGRGVIGLVDTDIVMIPICFVIGALVGCFACLVVMPCLARSNLRIATAVVYGPSVVVVIWYALTSRSPFYPLDTALPALVSVCFLSVLARFVSPRVHGPKPGTCPRCDYDLRGSTSDVCSECGATLPKRLVRS